MIPKKRNRSIALTVFALLLVLALVQGAFAFKSQTVKLAVEGSSAPIVVSPTHLDSSIYYSNNDPTFIWSYSSDSEIQGYSYAFDQSDLFTEPDTSVVENLTEKTYSDVADGSWYFHVKAVDVNGTWSDTAHYMVKIDTTPPTGSVSINGGAESTDDANVNLNLDASDLLSGVTSMRFAQSEEALQAELYEDYSATGSADLGEVNGLKTIFAQFKDAAGNESAVSSDGITLAPTPYDQAKLSIGINGKWFNVGDKVQISGKLTDISGAGLARYNVLIQVRGKIVATVRTQVGGGYSFEDQPVKTTPYKAIFIDKTGRKIITRAVVAHVKKAKKAKKIKTEKAKSGKKVDKVRARGKASVPKPVSTGSKSFPANKPAAGQGKKDTVPSTGDSSGSTNTPGNGHGKGKGHNKK